MMDRILRYREWSRMEAFVVLFLTALALAEIAVLILLEHGPGDTMAKAFGFAISWIFSMSAACCRWVYRMVGPMIFPLLILTGVEVHALVKLLQLRRTDSSEGDAKTHYKALRIVEGSAPNFGFLGTCLSLISTMQHMDPNLDQTAMLKTLLDNSASSFGSTVYGSALAVTAFLSLRLFKDFLMPDQTPKPEQAVELNRDRHLPVVLKKEVEHARNFRS